MTPPTLTSLIIMGVAGSGKSTLGAALARELGRTWLEGDEFHTERNRLKMATGEPLTDHDRVSWLVSLCSQLQQQPGTMLTCSALKRSYRTQLRQASPGLRFAFLDIDRSEAARRITSRSGHFFSAHLIDSQFETLEPPLDEPSVLRLDAHMPIQELTALVGNWLRGGST